MKTNSQTLAVLTLGFSIVPFFSLATGTSRTSHAIPGGYVTGTDFRKMSAMEQSGYATGLIDGYLTAPHFSGASPGWKGLHTCITQRNYDNPNGGTDAPRGMTNEQVTAILAKYLADHPEDWHRPMNMVGILAFYKSCGIKTF